MNASALVMQINSWIEEFKSISDEPVVLPPKLVRFLSARMVDTGIAQDAPDVIRVTVMGETRKVRIVGLCWSWLNYEPADGSQGFGMIDRRSVHQADLGKLSAILERMERDGSIRNGVRPPQAGYAAAPAGT